MDVRAQCVDPASCRCRRRGMGVGSIDMQCLLQSNSLMSRSTVRSPYVGHMAFCGARKLYPHLHTGSSPR